MSLDYISADSISEFRKLRNNAHGQFEVRDDRNRFILGCQEAALLIRKELGSATCKATVGFHVLCGSTPPSGYVNRLDFVNFNFSEVIKLVSDHVKHGESLDVLILQLVGREANTDQASGYASAYRRERKSVHGHQGQLTM